MVKIGCVKSATRSSGAIRHINGSNWAFLNKKGDGQAKSFLPLSNVYNYHRAALDFALAEKMDEEMFDPDDNSRR